jgi:mono/diheme cytochrome c family protein
MCVIATSFDHHGAQMRQHCLLLIPLMITLLLVVICYSPSTALAADSAQIKKGEYLVTIGICASCHSPKDPDGKIVPEQYLAGGQRVGGLLSPNLTSDIETGLGSWTDEQIIESIRNGIRPDGSSVRPPMGTFFYRDLSDDYVGSIVAYLRTVPAVKNLATVPVSSPK